MAAPFESLPSSRSPLWSRVNAYTVEDGSATPPCVHTPAPLSPGAKMARYAPALPNFVAPAAVCAPPTATVPSGRMHKARASPPVVPSAIGSHCPPFHTATLLHVSASAAVMAPPAYRVTLSSARASLYTVPAIPAFVPAPKSTRRPVTAVIAPVAVLR